MRKKVIFTGALVFIIPLLLTVFVGCGTPQTNTVKVTSTTTITTTTTMTNGTITTVTKTVTTNIFNNQEEILEKLLQSGEGVIDIEEYGSFYYKLFEGALDEDVVFHNVTFKKTTIQTLLPIIYSLSAGYADGTDELIMHNGTANDYYGVYFDFGQHEAPQAGVMMYLYDNDEGEHILKLYMLVEQE
jgi:hypothetical protein